MFGVLMQFFYSMTEIIRRVREGYNNEPFRPDTAVLRDSENGCPDYVLNCITECWADQPETRPDFQNVRDRLKKMREGM